MSSLADRVIQANDNHAMQQGPKLDDIGFPLPEHIDDHSMCEYLTARILYLNQYMYQYRGHLWLDENIIPETTTSYYRLAKYPKRISEVQCAYVWTRLRDMVPTLNTDIVAVLPGMTFNMRTGELRFENVRTTTPWKEKK